jgi:hypothetical protein
MVISSGQENRRFKRVLGVLKTQKSFYARHNVPHSSFSWTLRTIDAWIKAGYLTVNWKPKRAMLINNIQLYRDDKTKLMKFM